MHRQTSYTNRLTDPAPTALHRAGYVLASPTMSVGGIERDDARRQLRLACWSSKAMVAAMSGRRQLSYMALAVILVVYLVIIQGLGAALSQGTDAEYATFPDVETTLRSMTVPIALSVLFGVAVISVLRQWPEVVHEDHPVRSWVWIVPAVLVAASIGVIDYENLGTLDSGLLVTVVVSSLLVGIGEELMFRGVTLQALRDKGLSEHLSLIHISEPTRLESKSRMPASA